MENIKCSWRIDNFLKKNTENLQNVIYRINWTLTAVDLTNNITTAVASSTNLEIPTTSDGFISYEELTENQIISWLDQNLDIQRLNDRIKEQIEYNKSVVHSPNFPWN